MSLLGLFEDPEIDATGGAFSKQSDVRVMAATHRDLTSLVRTERWRADLYYRLSVVPIVLPPLRERGKDAALIAHAACSRLSQKYARPVVLEEDTALALCSHDWPGNVRQLVNLLERLALFSPDGRIRLRALQGELERAPAAPSSSSYAERRRLLEREELSAALSRTKGNRSEAARLLGVSRRTLYSRLKAAGV